MIDDLSKRVNALNTASIEVNDFLTGWRAMRMSCHTHYHALEGPPLFCKAFQGGVNTKGLLEPKS